MLHQIGISFFYYFDELLRVVNNWSFELNLIQNCNNIIGKPFNF